MEEYIDTLKFSIINPKGFEEWRDENYCSMKFLTGDDSNWCEKEEYDRNKITKTFTSYNLLEMYLRK